MLMVHSGSLEDLLAIQSYSLQADNRAEFAKSPEAGPTLARFSRFLYEDGVPIAAVGVMPKWEAVGYGWAVLSDVAVDRHALSLTRMARAAIVEAEEVGFMRIEAAVLLSFRVGLKWIRALGFEREGRAHSYGPGGLGTVVLFARVF
jgi:hypothetical protein